MVSDGSSVCGSAERAVSGEREYYGGLASISEKRPATMCNHHNAGSHRLSKVYAGGFPRRDHAIESYISSGDGSIR